jgi:hypothetical protein
VLEWMAFLNADEFIAMRPGLDLSIFLTNYEKYGGLALSWKVFGTGGRNVRPPPLSLVTQTYTRSDRWNRHVKALARPRVIEWFLNSHFPMYAEPKQFYSVDTRERRVSEAFNMHTDGIYESLWVQHYFSKSLEESLYKWVRGNKGSDGTANRLLAHLFWLDQEANEENCTALLRWGPALEKVLEPEEDPAAMAARLAAEREPPTEDPMLVHADELVR